VVAASLPVGQGALILVGDSRFVTNRNLEARETHYLGNILFLKALARGEPVQPIEGKFGDPKRELGPMADSPGPPSPAPAGEAPGLLERLAREADKSQPQPAAQPTPSPGVQRPGHQHPPSPGAQRQGHQHPPRPGTAP
jgi:hypothetical protein